MAFARGALLRSPQLGMEGDSRKMRGDLFWWVLHRLQSGIHPGPQRSTQSKLRLAQKPKIIAPRETVPHENNWNGVYIIWAFFFQPEKSQNAFLGYFFSEFSHFLKLFFDINTASISLNQSSFVKICCSWRGIDDFSTLLTFPCIAGMWQGVICDLGRRGIMIHISGKGVYCLGVMFFFRGNIITGGLLFERGYLTPPGKHKKFDTKNK